MIYVPQLAPGTYNGLNSAIDLMPTVLDIMSVNIPEQVKGKSLLPMLKKTNLNGHEYVISTIPFRNPSESVRLVDGQSRIAETGSDTTITTEEWSLLYHPDPGWSFLYHLPSDPKQEKNVIGDHPEVARKLHQYLVEFMKENNVVKELLNPRLELRI
jgi:arylsulfatase A-like enzyme